MSRSIPRRAALAVVLAGAAGAYAQSGSQLSAGRCAPHGRLPRPAGPARRVSEIEAGETCAIDRFERGGMNDPCPAGDRLQAPVALRVNPNVDAKTHAYISTGKSENKFGIEFDPTAPPFRHGDGLALRIHGG